MTLQVCRFSIAFIWLYQGIVPKLLGPHADELRMNMALGLNEAQAHLLSYVGGGMEVVLGLLVLVFYRQRWPHVIMRRLALHGEAMAASVTANRHVVIPSHPIRHSEGCMAMRAIQIHDPTRPFD